jgi:hypothetical protein
MIDRSFGSVEHRQPPMAQIVMPPDRSRVQRWKTRMSSAEPHEIVRQAGGLLSYLGYEVDALPASQQRVEQALRCCLRPQALELVSSQIRPHGGGGLTTRLALLHDRMTQLRALVSGRPETFIEHSLRWQRSLGVLLDTGKGQSHVPS